MQQGYKTARFWFVGMLLSVLPICATLPMNRNLLFVSIGAFALMAEFMGGFVSQATWLPKSKIWRSGAWVISLKITRDIHLLKTML